LNKRYAFYLQFTYGALAGLENCTVIQ